MVISFTVDPERKRRAKDVRRFLEIKRNEFEYFSEPYIEYNRTKSFSDKIVVMNSLKKERIKDKYIPLEITFEYKKTYNPAKLYRLAIVCAFRVRMDIP